MENFQPAGQINPPYDIPDPNPIPISEEPPNQFPPEAPPENEPSHIPPPYKDPEVPVPERLIRKFTLEFSLP